MFSDEQLLPISALQHLMFCKRQCALIHLEQVWAENRLTIEGQQLHRKVHAPGTDQRHDVRVARGLNLRSFQLGVVGKADIVEFHWLAAELPKRLPKVSRADLATGCWRVLPVEFKRGKPKANNSDNVQLCAQAMCLEEMLGVSIASGELFYGVSRRRTLVEFDAALRGLTAQVAEHLHGLIHLGQTPRAVREPKCDGCSLLGLCMPEVFRAVQPMSATVRRCFAQHAASVGPRADDGDLPCEDRA